MCPRDCDTIIFYKKCQHPIPVGACNKFAIGLNMCTADPIEPVEFDLRGMYSGGIVDDKCSFCKAGKDVFGDFEFGEMWEDRGKWRKAKE